MRVRTRLTPLHSRFAHVGQSAPRVCHAQSIAHTARAAADGDPIIRQLWIVPTGPSPPDKFAAIPKC
jgi:hypothetical protein